MVKKFQNSLVFSLLSFSFINIHSLCLYYIFLLLNKLYKKIARNYPYVSGKHPFPLSDSKWLINFMHRFGARHMLFRYLLFGAASHVNFANENSDQGHISLKYYKKQMLRQFLSNCE
jgi:hypothetical protein